MTRTGIVEKPLSSQNVAADTEQWGSIFQSADEPEKVTAIFVELLEVMDFPIPPFP